jgi:AcrR family transcriptional regulator
MEEAQMTVTRGAGARRRVLEAALQVLDEHGLAGFTMEAVARRAGASKATLYRHWPTSNALLVDAMDATFRPLPIPDTGSVEADVSELLTAYAALLDSTPYPRLLDAAERDPALKSLHADLTRRRREPLLAVLSRARDRGDLPAGLDSELTVDLLAAPLFYRRFVAHRDIPPALIGEVIARVLGISR